MQWGMWTACAATPLGIQSQFPFWTRHLRGFSEQPPLARSRGSKLAGSTSCGILWLRMSSTLCLPTFVPASLVPFFRRGSKIGAWISPAVSEVSTVTLSCLNNQIIFYHCDISKPGNILISHFRKNKIMPGGEHKSYPSILDPCGFRGHP